VAAAGALGVGGLKVVKLLSLDCKSLGIGIRNSDLIEESSSMLGC